MVSYSLLTLEIDPRGVAYVALNRPEIHNAFNDTLIAEITDLFKQMDKDSKVRMAVLSGHGKSFCAGGDLNWMKSMKDFSLEENKADGLRLAEMFATLRSFSKPLIGVIHGFALGGGSGLASVCDYVIASDDSTFGFTETRLGLVPATIAPFVIEKIGVSAARAYFISGAKFSAAIAREIGLVHQLIAHKSLNTAREEIIAEFLKAGPEASRKAKQLIDEVVKLAAQGAKAVTNYTVTTIAETRVSDEAQEGMSALLDGKKPKWAAQ